MSTCSNYQRSSVHGDVPFQFSLRAMLILTAVAAVLVWWISHQVVPHWSWGSFYNGYGERGPAYLVRSGTPDTFSFACGVFMFGVWKVCPTVAVFAALAFAVIYYKGRY